MNKSHKRTGSVNRQGNFALYFDEEIKPNNKFDSAKKVIKDP